MSWDTVTRKRILNSSSPPDVGGFGEPPHLRMVICFKYFKKKATRIKCGSECTQTGVKGLAVCKSELFTMAPCSSPGKFLFTSDCWVKQFLSGGIKKLAHLPINKWL